MEQIAADVTLCNVCSKLFRLIFTDGITRVKEVN